MINVEELRDKVQAYCAENTCDNCVLRTRKWEEPTADCGALTIREASEANLKIAYSLINSEIDTDINVSTVNHPKHYTATTIEAIDGIKGSMNKLEYLGFLKGNVLKYLWRYRHKAKPVEDLKKAKWYLEKLIEEVEG